jgi:hypothetical protein
MIEIAIPVPMPTKNSSFKKNTDTCRLIIVSIHLCGGSKAQEHPQPKTKTPPAVSRPGNSRRFMGSSGRAALE